MLVAVDKKSGISSFAVVRAIKKWSGDKKVGHAGTLDPLATGLLILATGRETKKLANFLGAEKKYEVGIDLARTTDTRDAEPRARDEDLPIGVGNFGAEKMEKISGEKMLKKWEKIATGESRGAREEFLGNFGGEEKNGGGNLGGGIWEILGAGRRRENLGELVGKSQEIAVPKSPRSWEEFCALKFGGEKIAKFRAENSGENLGRFGAGQRETALGEEILREKLDAVVAGQLLPVPPFSAKKVAGQTSYDRARRGEALELEWRVMGLKFWEVLEFRWPRLKLAVGVESGFYVRSLAWRLGGTVVALRRIAIGSLGVEAATGDILGEEFGNAAGCAVAEIPPAVGENWENFLG